MTKKERVGSHVKNNVIHYFNIVTQGNITNYKRKKIRLF